MTATRIDEVEATIILHDTAANPGETSTCSPEAPSSSSRRVTRSQTGQPAKRLGPDDGSPATKSRRRAYQSHHTDNTDPVIANDANVPSSSSVPQITPISDGRVTFPMEGPSARHYIGERRGPRPRAHLPVPVPNLTKKSRGRRVPTAVSGEKATLEKKRTYTCPVDGCGKCFNRGEHLKRHIRSIHTNDKPFQCTEDGCEKVFNRHDNLLQHLKVHSHTHRPLGEDGSSSSPPASSPASSHPHDHAASVLTALKYGSYPYPRQYGREDAMATKTTIAVSSTRTDITVPNPPRSGEQDHKHGGGIEQSRPMMYYPPRMNPWATHEPYGINQSVVLPPPDQQHLHQWQQ